MRGGGGGEIERRRCGATGGGGVVDDDDDVVVTVVVLSVSRQKFNLFKNIRHSIYQMCEIWLFEVSLMLIFA